MARSILRFVIACAQRENERGGAVLNLLARHGWTHSILIVLPRQYLLLRLQVRDAQCFHRTAKAVLARRYQPGVFSNAEGLAARSSNNEKRPQMRAFLFQANLV
jgi:hypothetical protein